ncbi:MAG: hypothetical protein Q9169_006672 [Polycauliona sp. 2 TL-2023]
MAPVAPICGQPSRTYNTALSSYTLFQFYIDYPPRNGLTCPQETLDLYRFESDYRALINLYSLVRISQGSEELKKNMSVKDAWQKEVYQSENFSYKFNPSGVPHAQQTPQQVRDANAREASRLLDDFSGLSDLAELLRCRIGIPPGSKTEENEETWDHAVKNGSRAFHTELAAYKPCSRTDEKALRDLFTLLRDHKNPPVQQDATLPGAVTKDASAAMKNQWQQEMGALRNKTNEWLMDVKAVNHFVDRHLPGKPGYPRGEYVNRRIWQDYQTEKNDKVLRE